MSSVSPDLLSQLLRVHGPALTLYARQWSRHAEDAVQEAFVELLRQSEAPERPIAWLYTVVRRRAMNAARSSSRRQRHEQGAASGSRGWFQASDDERLDAAAAAQALEGLELPLRETIVARLWGGLSYEEVAELTGTSISTAHRRYVTGLQRLRERLGVSCPPIPAAKNP